MKTFKKQYKMGKKILAFIKYPNRAECRQGRRYLKFRFPNLYDYKLKTT